MNTDDIPARGAQTYKINKDVVLGRGNYGQVFSGVSCDGLQNVAIKQFFTRDPFTENDAAESANKFPIWMFGLPRSLYQEVLIMKEIPNEQLIPVLDIFIEDNTVHTVMPLIKTDLKQILNARVRLTEAQTKRIILSILEGLDFLHSNWILHRDLSPGNIFIAQNGRIKIADYGMITTFGTYRKFSVQEEVVTLWYRAPELLFKADMYQNKIDLWSVGCIFAEMLRGGEVLFAGHSREDQLAHIFTIMGTPGTASAPSPEWPTAWALFEFDSFEYRPKIPLSHIIPNASPLAIDLLNQLLELNPKKRPSAAEALNHQWFSTAPLPCPYEQVLQIAEV